MDSLEHLAEEMPTRIAAAESVAELAELEDEAVGRSSAIAAARRGLGAIEDPDVRRSTGQGHQCEWRKEGIERRESG